MRNLDAAECLASTFDVQEFGTDGNGLQLLGTDTLTAYCLIIGVVGLLYLVG